MFFFFFFKQKTAYELRISDWSSDVCSSDLFIHPYFDVFVAEQVVELKLFPPYDKPAFTVSSREGLPEVHGKLVDSHIRELAIAERYLHFFRGQHRRLLRLVQGLRDGGQDVRMSLTAFRDGFATSGRNVWDYVFYAAVLEDGAMMNYLEHNQLPDYL